MNDIQIVTVDVRKLGLGMSHAFQGMSEVCASLGVPQDSMLDAVDQAESSDNGAANTTSRSGHTAGDVPGMTEETTQKPTTAKGAKGGAKRADKTDEATPGVDPVDGDGVDARGEGLRYPLSLLHGRLPRGVRGFRIRPCAAGRCLHVQFGTADTATEEGSS